MIQKLTIDGLDQHQEDGRPTILLVLDQFPEALGGGERIALRLASLLPQYGYRVAILTFFAHPNSRFLASATCPVYLLPLRKTYDSQALQAAFALRRFLAEHQIRIVQTFFESSDLWAGLVAQTVPDVGLIWSRRDMGILRTRKHEVAYRLLAQMPNAVVAVSELVRQHCIETDGVPADRVFTVYNGLDVGDWNGERPALTTAPRIVTVGNIRRVKGHDVFLQAAAQVLQQFPEAQFGIAGEVLEPEYFAELRSAVEALGIQKSFRFDGGVSDLQTYLSAADLFVLPSRSEGFSNSIIEAMAASLPVVATSVGGNAEAVQDGITGAIVPPGDAAALASAICRILSSPPLLQSMGQAGRARVERLFTTEAMMENLIAVYRKVLALL